MLAAHFHCTVYCIVVLGLAILAGATAPNMAVRMLVVGVHKLIGEGMLAVMAAAVAMGHILEQGVRSGHSAWAGAPTTGA